jgi:hypothetical protein
MIILVEAAPAHSQSRLFVRSAQWPGYDGGT